MVIDFLFGAESLKKVPRQGWIDKMGIRHPESVADHSYMTCLISMILSDMMGLDTCKVVRMAMLHDLAESRIGDMVPDQISRHEKKMLENAAMSSMLNMLPRAMRASYKALWDEFQNAKSNESRIVHDADKFEMALQARIYSKTTGTTSAGVFYDSARESIQSKYLQDMLRQMRGKDG